MLNAKQELFVTEYMRDRSAPDAAERAGYKRSFSARLMKTPAVADEIKDRIEELACAAGVDARWVLDQAVEQFKECIAEGDRKTALGYLKTVGDHVSVKAFDRSQEVNVNVSLIDRLNAGRDRVARLNVGVTIDGDSGDII